MTVYGGGVRWDWGCGSGDARILFTQCPEIGVPSCAILVARVCDPDISTSNGLRHGTQFGVPMGEEIAPIAVAVRGDAGSAGQAVARISECSRYGTHWCA